MELNINMNGGILTIMGLDEASTKGHSDNLAVYGNLGWNFFQNSNISLFTRNDKHKQTGKNNTYKLNFDQKFSNINFEFHT